jgi:hypothetical protein
MQTFFKMKHILQLILLSLFFITACKEKEPIISIPNTTSEPLAFKEGVNIPVDDLKLLIPNAYKKGKIAVFKMLNGSEIKFKIKFADSLTIKRELNGIKYTASDFKVDLVPLEKKNYTLGVKPFASFGDEKTLIKGLKFGQYLGFGIAPMNSDIYCTVDGKLDKTDPFNFYVASREFNGKVFKDVFHRKDNTLKSYSEVAYQETFGIIAFRDENNELFVFDRFE